MRIAMIDQKGVQAEFPRKASAKVGEEYDWQNIVTRLEEVYRGQ